jgi:ankyrin repeat protein
MTMMMEPSKSSLRFIAYQRFFTAVRSGDLDSLKQIVVEQPSDVSDLMSLQTDAGETALYIAADNNLEEVFRYLVKLCDFETVKIRSKSDLDAFHLAAKKGHLGRFSVILFCLFGLLI